VPRGTFEGLELHEAKVSPCWLLGGGEPAMTLCYTAASFLVAFYCNNGGDTVRYLKLYLSPFAGHLLDWFHVTMCLTAMNQMAKCFQSIAGAW
jgi:hypothetical protein